MSTADKFDYPDKLSGSVDFSEPKIIKRMTDIFDKSTKLRFRKPDEPSYIKFGTIRDKDPEYDIRSGQLKLAGFVHVLQYAFPRFMFNRTAKTSQTCLSHLSKLS